MKNQIGVIHSYYRSSIPSGENRTVDEIIKFLKLSGYKTSSWTMNSDVLLDSFLTRTNQALRIFTSQHFNNQPFADWVEKSDSFQIHNNFPVLSYGEYRVLLESKKPIIRVIHNYRKTCLSGNHFRNGNQCFKCNKRSTTSGILNSCYNNNLSKSLLYSRYISKINAMENEYVTKFVAISSKILEYLISIGIPPEKILVIENSVPKQIEICNDASEVLFIGRLEEEKGVKLALETWATFPTLPTLNIVGTGSLSGFVEQKSQKLCNVRFWGLLEGIKLQNVAKRCKTAIFPSYWEEPFGRTLIESIARGQSIVATNRGNAKNFFTPGLNGFIVEANPDDLKAKVEEAMALPLNSQITEGQYIWSSKYSPEIAEKKWKLLYEQINGTSL